MNYLAIIPLASATIFFIIGILSYNKNKESFLFFIFANLLALINFIFFNIMQSSSHEVIIFWGRLLPVWCITLPIFLHYIICFTENDKYTFSKMILSFIYLISLIFMFLEYYSLSNFFQNLNGEFKLSYNLFSSSSVFYPMRLFSSTFIISIFFICIWFYIKLNDLIKKKLLKYILFALIFVFICNLLPFFNYSYDMNLYILQFVFAMLPFLVVSFIQNKYTLQKRFMSHLFQDFEVKDDELAIVLNNMNEIIYVNEFFLNSLGYSEKEIIGENINKFLNFDVEFQLQSDDVNKFNISLKTHNDNLLKFVVNVVNFKDNNNKYIYTLLIGHSHGEQDKQKYLNICSYCKNVKISGTRWVKFEEYLSDNYNLEFTHGICSDCYKVIVHKYKSESE